jgi:hypothetical protein
MAGRRRAPRPGDPERARERALLDELAQVYRDIDLAFAEYRCPATRECCHFGVTGREPIVTSIELLALQQATAARGGPLAKSKRALPMYRDAYDDERICPLLGRDGRCSIYAARPLGCRSYWCHRAELPNRAVTRAAIGGFVRRIQAIAARHEHDGDRGRPLRRALGQR